MHKPRLRMSQTKYFFTLSTRVSMNLEKFVFCFFEDISCTLGYMNQWDLYNVLLFESFKHFFVLWLCPIRLRCIFGLDQIKFLGKSEKKFQGT